MKRFTAILVSAVALCSFALPTDASEISGGPVAVITCPEKGKLGKTVDLSTGTVPWIAEGPGLPIAGKALATPMTENDIPRAWKARMTGARWVQALPQNDLAPHAPGTYLFTVDFVVKKGKRMPQLSLTGQVTADEGFDLNLIEPSPANQHISSGIAYGDDTPGEVEQGDLQPLELTKSGDQSGKALGHRAGTYRLQIAVENGAAPNAALGLLAQVRLGVTCGGGK